MEPPQYIAELAGPGPSSTHTCSRRETVDTSKPRRTSYKVEISADSAEQSFFAARARWPLRARSNPRNAGRRERAHWPLGATPTARRARTCTNVTYRTNENRAACAWRPELEPVRCGAAPMRRRVHLGMLHASTRAPARTAPPPASSPTCVLRRPRPARRPAPRRRRSHR